MFGKNHPAAPWGKFSTCLDDADRQVENLLLDEAQRQALIATAGWKGRVLIRTRVENGQPIVEVQDNGIGMSQDTRAHCTEPHYSTKRNNALYAGLSAGMGLGLSFVQMILQHHGATLEIESAPLKGALFRVRFPATN